MQAMLAVIAFLFVLPIIIAGSGEGNIHLLEDEVGSALLSCSYNETTIPARNNGNIRRSRSNNYLDHSQYRVQVSGIDKTKHGNINNPTKHKYGLNWNKDNIPSYGRTNTSVEYVRRTTMPSGNAYTNSVSNLGRRKRNNYLIKKSDQDQCLSQCVFANLQVVDGRGIPREIELWNKMQTALTSQQSRSVLKDQLRACFQKLKAEDEDNSCSYSNKLERCLMLRFSDRKLNGNA